jgi:arabinan endo-1,5-alpha-L-arabinosidase
VKLPLKASTLLVAALALTLATGGTAVASQRSTHSAVPQSSAARQPAPSYRNPLALTLPSGGQAESCADPFVLHGQSAGDRHWYLYCTSDALTASELGPDGKPLIHNLPTYSSLDLTHWTYAGDALPTKPAWVAANGGLWAPDVVYRDGRYLMYFAASDTSLPGGGSAVGVATSPSPTGPWTDSGRPVVEPQDSPSSPGSRRWEFDPEVITAGGTSYLYFGSYFGGIAVRTLSADGLSSDKASQQQIAIDNRYEGTDIVTHDGWYYLLASATNCCNGPLTGYSVFAARSRSPLGPFLDRDGVSILAGRVGGTPVLAQNGNRWVGTGHNDVITDFSGQQWIVYHAVDRNDPYYAGAVGYTKRPVLLDPLDWKSGWPVVRGGRGPSDSPQPGPAAQPDQRTAYRADFVRNARPGKLYPALSDDFNGTALSSRWTWIRPPDPNTYTVSGGRLRWDTQDADLHPPAPELASVLTEPAPAGDYLVEAKVAVDTPAEGCCQNYVQGGLVIYNDDGNYLKLASVSIWNTRQTEWGKQVSPVPSGYPSYGNGVVGPVGSSVYLRIERRQGSQQDRYTAYTSLDGTHWDKGGTWLQAGTSATRLGLISMGGAGFTSDFDYVHVSALKR